MLDVSASACSLIAWALWGQAGAGALCNLSCSLIPGPRVSTQRSTMRMLRLPMTPMGSQRGRELNAVLQLEDGVTGWMHLMGYH